MVFDNEFSNLQLPFKIKLVLESGVLVGERTSDTHHITLYKLQNYFFEVYCDKDFSQIEDVRMLASDAITGLYK